MRLLSLLLLVVVPLGDLRATPPGSQVERPGRASLSVLFVGNSLISVNDLPETFRQLALASPRHAEVSVQSITVGGALIRQHWEGGRVAAALRNQRPDLLVLQAQSTEALLDSAGLDHHVRLFKRAADDVGAVTVILGTWARPARDPFYTDAASGGSPEAMQERLDAAYGAIAVRARIALAPVGKVWTLALRRHPEIPLLDGTQHPTRAGTYLVSAVLFQTLFGERVLGSSYDGGLPPGVAEILQRLAAELPLPSVPRVRSRERR
jgi:hypothetical protein